MSALAGSMATWRSSLDVCRPRQDRRPPLASRRAHRTATSRARRRARGLQHLADAGDHLCDGRHSRTHASPSTNAAEPKAASRRAPCDMPLIYARPRAPGKRTKERKPAVPAGRRFRDVTRIGPVQVATSYDNRGREKHTAACTAPRCGFSADREGRGEQWQTSTSCLCATTCPMT